MEVDILYDFNCVTFTYKMWWALSQCSLFFGLVMASLYCLCAHNIRVVCEVYNQQSIGGSVVEFLPATREARVRFPANAMFFCNGHERFMAVVYCLRALHTNIMDCVINKAFVFECLLLIMLVYMLIWWAQSQCSLFLHWLLYCIVPNFCSAIFS